MQHFPVISNDPQCRNEVETGSTFLVAAVHVKMWLLCFVGIRNQTQLTTQVSITNADLTLMQTRRTPQLSVTQWGLLC